MSDVNKSTTDETLVLLHLCLNTLDLITHKMPKYFYSKDVSFFCKLDNDCVNLYENIQEKSREIQLTFNQKQILYSHIVDCLIIHCNTNKRLQYIERDDSQNLGSSSSSSSSSSNNDNDNNNDINPKFVSNYNFIFYTLLGYLDKQIFENKLLNMLRDTIKSINLKIIYAGTSNKTSYEDLYAPIQRAMLKSTNCN